MICEPTGPRNGLAGPISSVVAIEDDALDAIHVVGRGCLGAISCVSGGFGRGGAPVFHDLVVSGQLVEPAQIPHLGRYFAHIELLQTGAALKTKLYVSLFVENQVAVKGQV